ncbi:MAG: hypothetical protein U0L72_05475 [Acutalibacteraceae bacterium]|nr:hypothetical protein [Acutalibacteraceae bacterium]
MVFKPDSTRSERSVWPLVAPGALGGKYANGGSAVYEQIERNGEKIDSLALSTVNYNSFIPIMKDGKPFELKPDTTYTVNISYYVTGNSKTSAPTLYVAGGTLFNTYFSSVAELGQNKIPAWDNALLGRPFSSAKVTLSKGTTTTLEDGTSVTDVTDTVKNTLVTKELTFTTKAAPADGDTSYSYDAEENVYTVAATDLSGNSVGDYSISNYFHIVILGATKLKLNITHLEITSEDYVPQTTVEYVVDGEVVKTEAVEQGTEYAINYVPANTATERFSGWYTNAELTSYITGNGAVTAGNDTIRYYGKMLSYENGVTNTLNADYYNSGRYPSFVDSVYQGHFSNRGNYAYGLTAAADSITIVPTQWRSTLIMPAINKSTGEYFVVQPGAEYNADGVNNERNGTKSTRTVPFFAYLKGRNLDSSKQRKIL